MDNPEQNIQKKSALNAGKPVLSIDPEIYRQINDISRRLRTAEENYSGLRRKTQLSDQNMLSSNKSTNTEIKTINSDIKDIKRDIKDINDKIEQIAKEMKLFAKKDEVLVIQKYVKLFDPMRFVSANQAEQIARDVVKEKENL